MDTGVDLTHPDFAGKLVPGINLVDATQAPADDVPEMFGGTFDSRFGYGRVNAMRAL